MRKEQSVTRAIRRGNAVIAFDSASKTNNLVYKKGSTKEQWRLANKNRSIIAETNEINSVTKPLSQDDIENSDSRNIIK